MVNLSVNQTRGHNSHKGPLVFSTVGLCGNELRSQIPFVWSLTVWIIEPVISVNSVFWPQPAWSNMGRPMGQSQVYKKSNRKDIPSPSGNDQFDQVARQEKWLSTLNNSDGISGTTLTSLQPEEWITSKVPTRAVITSDFCRSRIAC